MAIYTTKKQTYGTAVLTFRPNVLKKDYHQTQAFTKNIYQTYRTADLTFRPIVLK